MRLLAVARPLLVVSQVVFIFVLYFFGRATLATKTTQKRPSSSRIVVIASIDFEMVQEKKAASQIMSRSEFFAYHNHGQCWTQTKAGLLPSGTHEVQCLLES